MRPMIFNQRLMFILSLGFASGLPLALTGTTLQAWFTAVHADIKTVGALTLLGLPYTFKFLWAPVMDYVQFRDQDKRKVWIVLTQVSLALALFVMSFLDPVSLTGWLGLAALCVAFLSASQDIAINAYQTAVLHTEERALGVSYYVFMYRIAMLVTGGLALPMAAVWGFSVTYRLMATLMLLHAVISYFSPNSQDHNTNAQDTFWSSLRRSVANWFSREDAILLLLFIALYKVGDALALSLFTNFLLSYLHFSLVEVGLAYKSAAFIGTISGCFLGGWFLTTLSLYRGLFIFGVAQAGSNLLFALLAIAGKQYGLMIASVFIENFCSGMSTAALLALMMSLCDLRYAATQFALMSALASLGRIFLGPVASQAVLNFGWANLFLGSFLISIPALLILTALPIKGAVSDETSLLTE